MLRLVVKIPSTRAHRPHQAHQPAAVRSAPTASRGNRPLRRTGRVPNAAPRTATLGPRTGRSRRPRRVDSTHPGHRCSRSHLVRPGATIERASVPGLPADPGGGPRRRGRRGGAAASSDVVGGRQADDDGVAPSLCSPFLISPREQQFALLMPVAFPVMSHRPNSTLRASIQEIRVSHFALLIAGVDGDHVARRAHPVRDRGRVGVS